MKVKLSIILLLILNIGVGRSTKSKLKDFIKPQGSHDDLQIPSEFGIRRNFGDGQLEKIIHLKNGISRNFEPDRDEFEINEDDETDEISEKSIAYYISQLNQMDDYLRSKTAKSQGQLSATQLGKIHSLTREVNFLKASLNEILWPQSQQKDSYRTKQSHVENQGERAEKNHKTISRVIEFLRRLQNNEHTKRFKHNELPLYSKNNDGVQVMTPFQSTDNKIGRRPFKVDLKFGDISALDRELGNQPNGEYMISSRDGSAQYGFNENSAEARNLYKNEPIRVMENDLREPVAEKSGVREFDELESSQSSNIKRFDPPRFKEELRDFPIRDENSIVRQFNEIETKQSGDTNKRFDTIKSANDEIIYSTSPATQTYIPTTTTATTIVISETPKVYSNVPSSTQINIEPEPLISEPRVYNTPTTNDRNQFPNDAQTDIRASDPMKQTYSSETNFISDPPITSPQTPILYDQNYTSLNIVNNDNVYLKPIFGRKYIKYPEPLQYFDKPSQSQNLPKLIRLEIPNNAENALPNNKLNNIIKNELIDSFDEKIPVSSIFTGSSSNLMDSNIRIESKPIDFNPQREANQMNPSQTVDDGQYFTIPIPMRHSPMAAVDLKDKEENTQAVELRNMRDPIIKQQQHPKIYYNRVQPNYVKYPNLQINQPSDIHSNHLNDPYSYTKASSSSSEVKANENGARNSLLKVFETSAKSLVEAKNIEQESIFQPLNNETFDSRRIPEAKLVKDVLDEPKKIHIIEEANPMVPLTIVDSPSKIDTKIVVEERNDLNPILSETKAFDNKIGIFSTVENDKKIEEDNFRRSKSEESDGENTFLAVKNSRSDENQRGIPKLDIKFNEIKYPIPNVIVGSGHNQIILEETIPKPQEIKSATDSAEFISSNHQIDTSKKFEFTNLDPTLISIVIQINHLLEQLGPKFVPDRAVDEIHQEQLKNYLDLRLKYLTQNPYGTKSTRLQETIEYLQKLSANYPNARFEANLERPPNTKQQNNHAYATEPLQPTEKINFLKKTIDHLKQIDHRGDHKLSLQQQPHHRQHLMPGVRPLSNVAVLAPYSSNEREDRERVSNIPKILDEFEFDLNKFVLEPGELLHENGLKNLKSWTGQHREIEVDRDGKKVGNEEVLRLYANFTTNDHANKDIDFFKYSEFIKPFKVQDQKQFYS